MKVRVSTSPDKQKNFITGLYPSRLRLPSAKKRMRPFLLWETLVAPSRTRFSTHTIRENLLAIRGWCPRTVYKVQSRARFNEINSLQNITLYFRANLLSFQRGTAYTYIFAKMPDPSCLFPFNFRLFRCASFRSF